MESTNLLTQARPARDGGKRWHDVAGQVLLWLTLAFNVFLYAFNLSNLIAPVSFLTVATMKWTTLAYAITTSAVLVFFLAMRISQGKKAGAAVSQVAATQVFFTPLFWIAYIMFAEYHSVIGASKNTFDFYAIAHFNLALSTFHVASLIHASHAAPTSQIQRNANFILLVFVVMLLTLLLSIVSAYISFAELLGSEVADAKAMWIITVVHQALLILAFTLHFFEPRSLYQTGLYSVIASVIILLAQLFSFIELDVDYGASRDAPLQIAAQFVPLTEGVPWLMNNAMATAVRNFVALMVSYPLVVAISNFGKDTPDRRESGWLVAEIVLSAASSIVAIVMAALSVVWLIPGNTSGVGVRELFWVMVAKTAWDLALLVVAIVAAAKHGTIKHHAQRIWLSFLALFFSATALWAVSHFWAHYDPDATGVPRWKIFAVAAGFMNLIAAFAASQSLGVASERHMIEKKTI